MERLTKREQQDRAVIQCCLRMIDQQMDRDDACADNSARQRSTGPGDHGACYDARAGHSTVFDADFLQTRAWRNSAFASHTIVRARRASGLSVHMESRTVGENYELRLQAHGAVARKVTARY